MMGAACTMENRSVLNSVPAHVLKDQPLERSTTKTKTNSKKKERTTKKDTHCKISDSAPPTH